MNYEKLLDGKRAFITTGARGIGLGIARLFAKQGACIALGGKNEPKLECAINEIKEISPRSRSYLCDLSDESSVHNVCKEVLGDFGGIDILVNVVGVKNREPIHEYSDENLDFQFNTNYKSALICMRYCLPGMIERNHGNIIQISSIHSEYTMPGYAIYAGTKGALNATTRASALDYAKNGIRINAISPGLIMSDSMIDEVDLYPEGKQRDDFMKLLNGMQPLAPGSVDDVANAALYLASEMSAYVTGQSLLVDGGASIKAHP